MGKFVAASVALLFCVTLVMADEFGGTIKSAKDDSITVTKRGAKKGEKGEDVSLKVAKDAKILKGKFNKDTRKLEAGDPLEDGLKNELVTKGGAPVFVVTNSDGAVTELRVGEIRKRN